jgi:hypothetical protein
MRLNVLDDDRPGYAQLVFDHPLAQTTLALSVRSLTQAAFLGHDGKWQRTPHFFEAARIGGTANSAIFRVGPEVVNHLWLLDTIEFVTEDGSVHVEATWENAIPQTPEQQRASLRYGDAARALDAGDAQSAAEPASPPAPVEGAAALSTQESLEESPREIAQETPPPPTQEAGAAPRVSEPNRHVAAIVAVFSRYRLYLLGVLGVLMMTFTLYQVLPCDWPGKDRCGPTPIDADRAREETVLREARACAADATRGCATPGCYADYLNAYGQSGAHKDDAQQEAAALAQKCPAPESGAKEAVALRFARECARGPQRCSAPNCYADFLAKFGTSGKYASEGRAEAAQLDADCRDHERQSVDDKLWKTASTCAAAAQRCTVKSCYRTYNDLFGTTGRHSDEARREIARAESDCARGAVPSPVDDGLAVNLGDTYDDIKRVYGTTKNPQTCEGCTDHPKVLRLDDRGLWFFFDAAGKINLIRFDPPWTGSVQGIRLGDPTSKIERLLGTPNDGDGPDVGQGPYYYEIGGDKRYFYRRNGTLIATFLIDAFNKVEAILIP